MTILAVGDEVESFINYNSSATQTSTKDPGQRGGLVTSTSGSKVWDLKLASSVDECWVHDLIYSGSGTSSTDPIISLRNSATGKDALRFVQLSLGRYGAEIHYNSSGSAYTKIADSEFTFPANTPNGYYIDIYFKRGASGVLKVWVEGVLVVNTTGNYATVDTTWDTVRIGSAGASTTYHAAVICADESTINMTLDHLSPNAAGTNTGWTNASGAASSYVDVADAASAPDINTSTQIKTNTTGQKFTPNLDSVAAIPTSRKIRAVQLAARGVLETGSAITDVLFLVRHGGTDYTLGSLSLGTSDTSAQQILEAAPDASAWDATNVNALEVGVISA